MKKLLIVVALFAAMPLFAKHVDPEIARKVAITFLRNNGAKAAELTDLTDEAGFPNLYVFTTEESFVILSADDCVKPILGYSLTGKFVTKDMPENLVWWLQGYNDEIQYAVDNQIKASSETAQQWNDFVKGRTDVGKARVVVEPLIQTRWGQGSPYNGSCPSGTITGCVATAMAQIMKYWNYPTRGIGSHSYQYSSYGTISADFGATDYDWLHMTNTYSSSSTQTQKAAVATLMYHCGVSVEMQYGPKESGSNTKRSSIAMNTYFNYNTSYIEKDDFTEAAKWTDTLKYELNNGRPILYSGYGTGGHAFVCDGYNSDGKFHFNWGWEGKSDGYFPIDSLTPDSFNFNFNQAAVIGIYPLTDNTTPISLENSHATLSWTDSQSCDSFNIYRNDALIATSTTTTFTDPNPAYGTNKYYVRGLSNTVLTQPSNYAIVTVDYPTPAVNSLQTNLSENGLALSWNASDWCFPAAADAETFSYVDEERQQNNDLHYIWDDGNFVLSWGHRYPAENLTSFNGKVIHEVSFFSMYTGSFDIVVYQGTEDNRPIREIARESITTARIGWSSVCFNIPVTIDSNLDLWIFVINTDCKVHKIYHNTINHNNGCYYSGSDPTQRCYQLNDSTVWFIRAYLTDGTYTYNLYQDDVKIAENLSGTNYSASLNNNAANQFIVKTKYYGGEAPSNMVGHAKGHASLDSLELGATDTMTLTSGSTLTVGTLTNSNPENLVLENGAQLITNSINVAATVKRDIATFNGSNDKGHWYFIASPMTKAIPVSATNLTSTTLANYDLYIFDQDAEGQEWRNYKQEHFTTIDNKRGYLYANAENTCVTFADTLNNTSGNVPLAYGDKETTFRGYNLIGNPYPCNATITKDYLRIVETEEGSTLQVANTAIAPMEGVVVKSTGTTDNSITFTKLPAPSKSANTEGMITLNVVRGQSGVLDNARIRFEGNLDMEKLTLHKGVTQLSIEQDGREYALVVNSGQFKTPVHFKAAKDGLYTINVAIENLDLGYLHLVDRLTGADIDLKRNPSYSFEAKTDDDAARFQLLLHVNNNDNSDNFAFVNDGQIIVYGIDEPYELQIIDVTGRVVNKTTPGMYVLRLTTDNSIKTQKIIIK